MVNVGYQELEQLEHKIFLFPSGHRTIYLILIQNWLPTLFKPYDMFPVGTGPFKGTRGGKFMGKKLLVYERVFPGEGRPRFFFSRFPPGPPQIINGRPLRGLLHHLVDELCFCICKTNCILVVFDLVP